MCLSLRLYGGVILEPAVQRLPPTTSRKFGETDRAGNTTGEAGLVEQWLGKYLIKQRDERTLLVYPRTDNNNNTGGSGESEVGLE